MKLKKFGNSGLLVSEFGLGTARFAENSTASGSTINVKELIDPFIDNGGNHIENILVSGKKIIF